MEGMVGIDYDGEIVIGITDDTTLSPLLVHDNVNSVGETLNSVEYRRQFVGTILFDHYYPKSPTAIHSTLCLYITELVIESGIKINNSVVLSEEQIRIIIGLSSL
jgi:hypothetical protein